MTAPPAAPAPALVFDKYEIIRRLAVGGMGEIFLARQHGISGFERLIILKSLLPQLTDKEENIELFLDEARVAANLNHPNIVGIYEVGKWEGVYYIAMEYIHGANLGTLLETLAKTQKNMPPSVAAKIVHDAALALDSAHHAKDTQGRPLSIVHRDISPQNIMVRDDGVTKVVDFGIAKAANRSTHTATGTLKGKLSYMAPEQISALPLDARADQWALGVVFWEMCTGRRLFTGDDAMQTIRQIVKMEIKPPSTLVAAFPPAVDMIVLQMLERNRDLRFERCMDVAQAIKKYLDATTTQVGEVEVAKFIQETVGERIQEVTRDLTPSKDNFIIPLKTGSTEAIVPAGGGRRGLMAGLGAAAMLLVAGLAVGGYFLFRPTPRHAKPVVGALTPPVATLPSKSEPAILKLTSTPPGASVSMAGKVLGSTPMTIDSLAAGTTQELLLEKRGFQPYPLSVRLEAGKTREESATLAKLDPKAKGKAKGKAGAATTAVATTPGPAPATDAGPGFLTVKTVPWTSVYAGDKLIGETTFSKVEMPPGTYTLKLVNPDEGISVTRTVTIKAGEVTKLDLNLKK